METVILSTLNDTVPIYISLGTRAIMNIHKMLQKLISAKLLFKKGKNVLLLATEKNCSDLSLYC